MFCNSVSLLGQNDKNAIGFVGINVTESKDFNGTVFEEPKKKSKSKPIYISTDENINNDSTYIYIDGDMNFIDEYAQFYCYEVRRKKWYKIYIDAPINNYVWIKKQKKTVLFYKRSTSSEAYNSHSIE